MKNSFRVISLLILMVAVVIIAAPKKKEFEEKELLLQKKVAQLREQLSQKEQLTQSQSEKRWVTVQNHIKVKEADKERLDNLQQQIEQLYADVARAREERLARESALEKENEILQQKETAWDFIFQTVQRKQEKETDLNPASFPLDQEQRMVELNRIDRAYPGKFNTLLKLKALFEFKLSTIRQSMSIGYAHRSFLVGNNQTVEGQVVRIGYNLAFAQSADNKVYYLGNLGKSGRTGYEWYETTNPIIIQTIQERMPQWLQNQELSPVAPIDVVQNKYSSSLIADKKKTWQDEFKHWMIAGGPVMVPLALLVLWAFFIIINRLIVFSLKHRISHSFINEALNYLSTNQIDNAVTLSKKRKSALARILEVCLKHKDWKRSVAEKSVKELLLGELPGLDKHLNTLAVLAAAAPLLGLLGTITGMIRMFEAITRFGTGDPKLLAGGISEALITTEAGLIISIPVLLVHNFLRNRRNTIQAHIERYAMQILNRLWPED